MKLGFDGLYDTSSQDRLTEPDSEPQRAEYLSFVFYQSLMPLTAIFREKTHIVRLFVVQIYKITISAAEFVSWCGGQVISDTEISGVAAIFRS